MPNLNISEFIAVFLLVVSGLMEMTILIEVVLSWFSDPINKSRFRIFIEEVNSPLLGTIRKFVSPRIGLDFSPLIAILLLEFIPGFLIGLLGVDTASLLSKFQL